MFLQVYVSRLQQSPTNPISELWILKKTDIKMMKWIYVVTWIAKYLFYACCLKINVVETHTHTHTHTHTQKHTLTHTCRWRVCDTLVLINRSAPECSGTNTTESLSHLRVHSSVFKTQLPGVSSPGTGLTGWDSRKYASHLTALLVFHSIIHYCPHCFHKVNPVPESQG